jgi:membrane-bound lytic murein transglycosylase MltF
LLERFSNLRSTGDLGVMAKRRFVRALVVYSKTFYFLDRGRERGMIAEGLQAFEEQLNAQLNRKRKGAHVHVVAVPVSRDQLVPWLLEGKGDLAAANLTITPERLKEVAFSQPFYENAAEVVVTAPDVPVALGIDDLSGQEVCVRKSSSCAPRQREPASMPISGSTTSSASRPNASATRRSSTWRTSTSTTSPTPWSSGGPTSAIARGRRWRRRPHFQPPHPGPGPG